MIGLLKASLANSIELLQRGYQVYTEVCASCHSLKHLSYRNLAEKGGPEFTELEAKAIASNFEVTDGPNSDGEMFERPAKLSDKFVMPYATFRKQLQQWWSISSRYVSSCKS